MDSGSDVAGSPARAEIAAAPVIEARGLEHRYGGEAALGGVDLMLAPGRLLGVIGPDGVGKSTLLSLVAGARRLQRGELRVLGGDLGKARARRSLSHRIAFMPQGLGANLYAELSVAQNLDFFGRIFELPRAIRRRRAAELLEATGLASATDRRVGQLSGGMKQKLGLCCALIHEPDLLILDEPTTGVDPLSRRAFWELIADLRTRRPSLGVLAASAYMGEAADFDDLLLLSAGRALATGTVPALLERTGAADLEAAYAALLEPSGSSDAGDELPSIRSSAQPEVAIRAVELTKRFGSFVAVDQVSFEVARGEIFGFIGPNGCGKTTTMKMVTGILPPTSGEAHLLGEVVDASSLAVRRRIGYMSQSFSLHGDLTPRENLVLYGRLFDLSRHEIDRRVDGLAAALDLAGHLDVLASELPLGMRQRLGLAVALLHRPDVLVLDEPTSGVDPLARERFWRILRRLASGDGTTIFVTTHYLMEACRCHRVALMNQGRLLATASPDEIAAQWGEDDLEAAFIRLIREDLRTGGAGEGRL